MDKEKQYRGVKGETHIIRIMTNCKEVRQHFVDDVRDPDPKTGEPQGFNQNCSREWDDTEEEYLGDCMGCDRDYDINTKLVTGILHVGTIKGRAKVPTVIEPENAVKYWDFGLPQFGPGKKFKQIREIHFDLEREGKRLPQVELQIKTEKEKYQDLTITRYNGPRLTTKAHAAAFKEEGQALVDEFCKAPSLSEQKRNLKKRRPRRGKDSDDAASRPSRTRGDEPAQDESTGDEEMDDLLAELG
jgi:hypothetical protein